MSNMNNYSAFCWGVYLTFICVFSETAARLKQLELESSPLLATQRNNVNINMAMNNQVGDCSCSVYVNHLLLSQN